MIVDRATKTLLRTLEKIEYGSLEVVLPDGQSYIYQGDHPGVHGHILVHNTSIVRNLLHRGDIAFADDYRHGLWDSENVGTLLQCVLQNYSLLHRYAFGNRLQQWLASLRYLFRCNSRTGSKNNIHAHYDIGNDFYRLWLDPSMTYSSALFQKTEDLSTAQNKKYDRLLARIGKPSQSVLEVGCGWGGFAERCISQYDHRVDGITISRAQWEYAQKRLQHADNARLHLIDYRDVKDKFDAVVSIEMFEAVGEQYWCTYFDKIAAVLNDKGKALIQTITMDDAFFAQYRKCGDAIRDYIFPGGMLPSMPIFTEVAQKSGLHVSDAFAFGQDYARTLSMWLEKFDDEKQSVIDLGFDEKFIRLWRFYLSYCMAGFAAERINVMQIELQHQ